MSADAVSDKGEGLINSSAGEAACTECLEICDKGLSTSLSVLPAASVFELCSLWWRNRLGFLRSIRGLACCAGGAVMVRSPAAGAFAVLLLIEKDSSCCKTRACCKGKAAKLAVPLPAFALPEALIAGTLACPVDLDHCWTGFPGWPCSDCGTLWRASCFADDK